MRNPLGIVFLLVGIVLLVLGLVSSDSLASSISRFFTNEPTDRAIWFLIGGVASLGLGLALGWRGSRA